MRDAYDALEAAQVLAIHDGTNPAWRPVVEDPLGLAALGKLIARLPTQTYRSEDQIARQQFSTPITLAYPAVRAADVSSSDTILEPSAGTGMLAAWLPFGSRHPILNEIDEKRAGILVALYGTRVTRHDAEYIHDLLAPRSAPASS